MEFRLLFSGDLPSTGNKSKASEVHAIRRTFHPQLRRLWTAEENLRQLASNFVTEDPRPVNERTTVLRENDRFSYGIKAIGANWTKAGFDWVPLVTKDMALRCAIDVLLLRPDIEDRFIFRRGDLDGHIKTLIDALKMPENADGVGKAVPQPDEMPFFVLLHDDRLVTEVRVTTDKLLLLPNQSDVKPNDCLAIIHVRLNHRSARTFDNYFG